MTLKRNPKLPRNRVAPDPNEVMAFTAQKLANRLGVHLRVDRGEPYPKEDLGQLLSISGIDPDLHQPVSVHQFAELLAAAAVSAFSDEVGSASGKCCGFSVTRRRMMRIESVMMVRRMAMLQWLARKA